MAAVKTGKIYHLNLFVSLVVVNFQIEDVIRETMMYLFNTFTVDYYSNIRLV